MGTFVDKIGMGSVDFPAITPSDAPTDFTIQVNPSAPWEIVRDRFADSTDIADEFKALVTGGDGYLQRLADSVEAFPETKVDDITYEKILPVNIEDALTWYETAFTNTLYDAIQAKLLTDLIEGSSGIGGTVEQDIFDRDVARMAEEEALLQDEIEERLSSTGFDLPNGALVSALSEHDNKVAMRVLDTSQKISAEQADLAQKNSQFAITASISLDTMLRNFIAGLNQRSLDYKKAVAAHIIAAYDLYLRDAGNVLLAATSSADVTMKGYQAEYGLRSEVAKALTAAAMQAFASSFGAVNASAGLSYSGGESVSETISHSEAKQHSTNVSLTGSVQATVSNTLAESHEYKE